MVEWVLLLLLLLLLLILVVVMVVVLGVVSSSRDTAVSSIVVVVVVVAAAAAAAAVAVGVGLVGRCRRRAGGVLGRGIVVVVSHCRQILRRRRMGIVLVVWRYGNGRRRGCRHVARTELDCWTRQVCLAGWLATCTGLWSVWLAAGWLTG